MASSREYAEYIAERLSLLDGITMRRMMGEYIIYYKRKIAAYICGDRLLVKPVPAAKRLMPEAPLELPYEGAREIMLVEETDDREFLRELFTAMYDELPVPKKRNG